MSNMPYSYEVLTREQVERLLAITPEAIHHLMDASAREAEPPRDHRSAMAEVARRISFAFAA